MKFRFSLLLAGVLLTLTPIKSWGQSITSLNQQLQQSVGSQNWSQAIQIIDQMVRVSPEQAASLNQYRAQLQRLQQSQPAQTYGVPTAAKAGVVGQIPIKRRSAGVPVVDVTFNGRQSFEMLVDSGASFTVITRPMAKALGITGAHIVDTVRVSTANGTTQFPIVYVSSVDVGGLKSTQIPVAIAGPDMKLGLLGQDFLQKYDVLIRARQIEFSRQQ
ncbi:MAG: retropepsin-like aspartic protease [Cyanobacteria bacterium P01_A01_bin.17]